MSMSDNNAEVIASKDQALAYWTDTTRFPSETRIAFDVIIERNYSMFQIWKKLMREYRDAARTMWGKWFW